MTEAHIRLKRGVLIDALGFEIGSYARHGRWYVVKCNRPLIGGLTAQTVSALQVSVNSMANMLNERRKAQTAEQHP
jgi:hypothetical protein